MRQSDPTKTVSGARVSKPRRRLTPADWEALPDEELLALRIRDLGLEIEGTPVEAGIEQLYRELDAQGIAFHPPCYLADEWFCPDLVPIIGIPFCLAHPRLKQIEKKLMLEVEGGTPESFIRLLRHECGHAINYAYTLYRRTRWRELFGPFSTPYGNTYTIRPYSKRFVSHLEDNYAQSHPDEDFAETFAVWLDPHSGWEERYADWPAIRKLRYVDKLMREVGPLPPRNRRSAMPWSASRMTSTLAAHYDRKRKHLGEEFPGYYDASLERIFPDRVKRAGDMKASRFLRLHRKVIIDSVSNWTGPRKVDVSRLITKLVRRCDVLDLGVTGREEERLIQLTAFITAVMNSVLCVNPYEEKR